MTKQQLIDELRKQGYARIADMLDAEPLRVEIAPGLFAIDPPAPTHEHEWVSLPVVDTPPKKKAK